MSDTKDKTRNNSIDLFRLLCAVLVISVHTDLFLDQNYYAGYAVTQVIPRIIVPFFFLTSGYYYLDSLQRGERCLLKTLLPSLRLYAVWSVFYFLKDFLSAVKNGEELSSLPSRFIANFFVWGSSYHFWYFPVLFFAILVSTAAWRAKLLKSLALIAPLLYLVGLLGCSYHSIGLRIPGISALIQWYYFDLVRRMWMMGLPFFLLGYFIPAISRKLKVTGRHLFIVCVFYVAEILFVEFCSLASNIVCTIGLYFLLIAVFCRLLQHPLPNRSRAAKTARRLSAFIYCVHPLNIWIVSHLLPATVPSYLLFPLILFLSLGQGMLLLKLDNRALNVLLGERFQISPAAGGRHALRSVFLLKKSPDIRDS